RTRVLVTSTSNPAHPDSTAKSNAHTASTPKNSTVYSTASSSTTPKYSTTNSKNGKTTTTTTDPTAPSTDKHPMKDSARKPTQLSPIYHSRTHMGTWLLLVTKDQLRDRQEHFFRHGYIIDSFQILLL